jgi:hypothetical protein
MNLVYVNGEAAAALGYVNAGTDRRVGGWLGKRAGALQSAQSFKNATPPTKVVTQIGEDIWMEVATAPNGKEHVSIAAKRGKRWATVRYGYRFDPNWGDAGTIGYNPDPEIVGGYIYDGVIKLNAPVSFIEGVE